MEGQWDPCLLLGNNPDHRTNRYAAFIVYFGLTEIDTYILHELKCIFLPQNEDVHKDGIYCSTDLKIIDQLSKINGYCLF